MDAKDLVKLKVVIDERINDPELGVKVFDTISNLPQVAAIKFRNAHGWILSVTADPTNEMFGEEQVLWHAKRLRGFGGSEIGTLVADKLGMYNPFTSPWEILAGKLMILSPDESNFHTMRGTLLEDAFRETSIERLEKHTAGFKYIENPEMTPDEDHPWLVGNPDFVYMMGDRMMVNDFKIPGRDKATKTGEGRVDFDYVAQVHHYMAAMLGKEGIKKAKKGLGLLSYNFGSEEPAISEMIDRTLTNKNTPELVETIIAKGKVVIESEKELGEMNPYGAKFSYIPIPYSQHIVDKIYECGDEYYDMMLKGELPDSHLKGKAQEVVVEDDVMLATAKKAVYLRAMSVRLREKADEFEASIKEEVLELGGGKNPVQIGLLKLGKPGSVTTLSRPDEAVALAKKLGIPERLYQKVNQSALLDELKKQMESGELESLGMIKVTPKDQVVNYPRKGSKLHKEVDETMDFNVVNAIEKIDNMVENEMFPEGRPSESSGPTP